MVIANDMMHTFIDGLHEYIRVSSIQRGSDVTCICRRGNGHR